MAEIEALCMTCKHDDDAVGKKNMTNVRIEEDGGRYSARGECPDCGSNMFKFMSEDDAQDFAEEAGIDIEHVGDDE
jgi:Zn finger protein HypA/HybF involved in hydrogenase expression